MSLNHSSWRSLYAISDHFRLADMHDYPELTHACEDMQAQSEFYRFTVFWDEASSRIVTEICTHGVERFRSSLNYFLGLALLKKHLSGDMPVRCCKSVAVSARWARCCQARASTSCVTLTFLQRVLWLSIT